MENYMMDKNVKRYYEVWARSPTIHPFDMRNFYKFVKACVNHVGSGDLGRKLSIDILKLSLYDSFHEKYNDRKKYTEEAYDEFVHKIVVLFEHLRDYEDAKLP